MKNSIFDLTGKVALVSGASSGMGRAASLALADHGANLLLVDINMPLLNGFELSEKILAIDINVRRNIKNSHKKVVRII